VASVKDMKLSAQKKSGSAVRAEITLLTYMYRPVGSPPPPRAAR